MSHHPKRLLLVGGSGKVGTLLTSELGSLYRLTVLDPKAPIGPVSWCEGRVQDPTVLQAALENQEAAIYLALGDTQDQASNFETQVDLLRIFLSAAHHSGLRRFVYASTMSVYSQRDSYPLGDNTPCDATHSYGRAKRGGELVCQEFSERFRLLDSGFATLLAAGRCRMAGARGSNDAAV